MILKEYLVALGFKIDDASYAKFMGAAAKTASGVATIATEAIAAATAIGIFTERVARNFSDLYYAAQRNETTVAGLQRIQYGFSQIGLSAEKGRSAVENLNSAMRQNVAISDLVKQYTGETDPQKALPKLVDFLRAKYGPSRIGYQNAAIEATQIFHQDEETFRALWQNNDKYKAMQAAREKMEQRAGVDPNKMADDSRKFIDQINQLLEKLGLLKDRTAQDLIGPASKVVAGLDYLVDAFTTLSTTLSDAILKGEGLLGIFRKWKDQPVEAGKGVVGTVGGLGQDMLLSLSRVLRKISDWRDASEDKKVGAVDNNGNVSWPSGVKNLLPGFPATKPTKSSKAWWGDDEAIAAGIYDAPALTSGGGKPVTVNNHTEIKVEQGPTARATAEAVAERQKRVYSDQTRNTLGNTR